MRAFPTVPNGDIVPVVRPMHLKQSKATLFKYFHTVVFYGNSCSKFLRPSTKQGLGIFISHNYQIQSLAGPKI